MKTAELILLYLKSSGAHSAKMLADRLAITTMGVRQHMLHLEQKGLVCYEDTSTKVGRPTRFWSLTAEGHLQFPDRHNVLSNNLISSVKELFGKNGLDQLIEAREDKLFQHYNAKLQSANSLEEKLNTLVEFRLEDGYMAELVRTETGEFLIVENHCPIKSAASNCHSLCKSEANLFNRLLAEHAQVERTKHIIGGSRHCTYLIKAIDLEPTSG